MLTGSALTKEWLKNRLAIEEAVSKISRIFLSSDTSDFNEILPVIGKATCVNRIKILCFSENTCEISAAYKWSAVSNFDDTGTLENSVFIEWLDTRLKRDKIIMVADTNSLPDEAMHEKKMLQAENIRSILAVPIFNASESLLGAMCFIHHETRREWLGEEVQTFRVISEMISSYLERKKVVEALEKSEKRYRELYEESKKAEEVYRSLINSSADAIVISDLEGKTNYVSPSFTHLFGWSLEEVEGKEIEFIPEYEKKIQQTIIDEITGTGKSCQDIETSRYTKDRRAVDISLSASRYDDHEGNPAGILYLLRDISERKELEAQLIQSQKMEAVGILAGGIAHDFNNNLQAIFGCTEILLMGKDESHPDYSKLRAIEKAIQRAGNLTRRLLVFSRKMETNFIPVDLNHEVDQVSKILERTIPKMINIGMDLDTGIKPIKADSAQLEQILMNLGINAKDAMPDGGELLFKTESAFLDEIYCSQNTGVEPGEYSVLTISDTGCGIDKDTLGHIFEPFFTTKEKGQGTGLGLAMVYSIIKSHGGHITCMSIPGKGSSFRIYFPSIIHKTNKTADKIPMQAIKGGNEKILFIEDDETNREIGEELLTEFGYKVFTASDSDSAINFYSKNLKQIDLIISDLIIPGIGGKKLIENILTLNPDAKVIVASGYNVEETSKLASEWGVKGFISKPYEMNKMLNVVRQVLN